MDAAPEGRAARKKPHDIDEMLKRIGKAVSPYPKAAMFELAEDGFKTVFEQLVACIISIRTRDEATIPIARRLFEVARTPAEMMKLSATGIDALISPSTFHGPKARTILEIAKTAIEKFGGARPCSVEKLMELKGVGPKCAHLVVGVACGQKRVSVDIHVHRVTNRWEYVQANTPEKTLAQLVEKLPEKHWIAINRLLVPFGKHICTGVLPKCSTCPVLEFCRQVGVTKHR
jgi:endonuclease-3